MRSAPGSTDPTRFFRWAEQLRTLLPRVEGVADWESLQSQIDYAVRAVAAALDQGLGGDERARWQSWRDRYLEVLRSALAAMWNEAAGRSRDRNRAIRSILDPLLPEERREATLSRKALWTAASTPGVSSVLNGMRRAEYVEDARAILEWPLLEDPLAIYSAMRGVRLPQT